MFRHGPIGFTAGTSGGIARPRTCRHSSHHVGMEHLEFYRNSKRSHLKTWAVRLIPLWIALGTMAILAAFERSLVYFPARFPQGDWAPQGLQVEDAWITTADGLRIHGWYVPHSAARAQMLFAHGNAGNITHRTDWLVRLNRELGLAVLIFDYRGYGKSAGRPHEAGLLSDARAARQWLAERAGCRETDIVLYGESLGGGVVVNLASHDGARALILESTFTSLPDVAAHHYRWLPVRLLMREQLNSQTNIARYTGPLLIGHGDADRIIPVQHAEQLFDSARSSMRKRLVILPGHDHNDRQPDTWITAIDELLRELAPDGT